MGENFPEISVLDYVMFYVSALDNSYEALICCTGVIEKFTHGPLDQLAVHLPEARASPSPGSFILQLDESNETSLWFNKFTVARFLHIVNAPNMLKLANAIEDEISQLEETRKFHIALYAKDQLQHSEGGTEDISSMNDISLTHPVKVETASLDATKNELLRALDLRLAALKEELVVAFNSAASATCFSNQIFDLASFAQHFGATELRKSLLKLLELFPNIPAIDSLLHRQTSLNDSVNINRMDTKCFLLKEETDVVKAATANVFPAKVAQAEQESSSESADSSDSSDGDNPLAERSRLVVRSATPRRTASPMRRIQIGRAGSRRSTALTVKSLNYFQSRERAMSNRDADARENGEEEQELLPKKPENNVGSMSVQDAINLFESKQTVQNSDSQIRKTSEVSISANKSVLRRWSPGMGDSCNYSTKEKPSDSCYEIAPGKLDPEREDMKENDLKNVPSNPEIAPICMSAEIFGTEPLQVTIPTETVLSTEGVDSKDQSSTVDWNHQKEAELNDMRKKMMIGNNPTKYSAVEVGKDVLKDTSLDQRGGFYSQYSERRNRKLRSENARNHGKEEQFKLTREKPGKNKAAMASRFSGSALKRESTNLSEKPRRIFSPVLSKKEISKPTNKNKVSSKSSSSLQSRSSFPSGSSEKVVDTLPAKSPPMVSTGSISSRQKSQFSISPALPSPRIKKSQHMENCDSVTSVQASIKPSLFGQEHKIVKLVKKKSIDVRSRSPFSREDCGTLPSKSTVQSKYTRKSSVVPLESKPFLRKGSGIIPVNGPLAATTKDARVSKPSDSLKNIENIVLPDEQEFNNSLANSTIKVIEDDLVQPTNVVDKTLAAPHDNDSDNIETMDIVDGSLTRVDTDRRSPVELTITENLKDKVLGISSAAWADAENEKYSLSSNSKQHHVVLPISPIIAPVPSSSPLVRHSLSQMLQAENNELEIIEWGNSENPPSLVYQKDAPKGLKRLLMFARKSKGEDNLSPSVFSEGEEEHEESKASIRSSDAPLQKPSFQAQGYGQPKGLVSESLDLGRSIKKAMEHRGVQDDLSGSEKLRNAHFSTGVTASKATRSFFSLSSFRSGKSSETKPR